MDYAAVRYMVTRWAGKLKSPVVMQTSFELRKFEDFSKPTGKGNQWTTVLCVGGKNRAADTNFGEKTAPRGPGLSKQQCIT